MQACRQISRTSHDDMPQELVEASVRLATHPHIGLASAAASIRGMQSGRGQRPPHMGRQVCYHELVGAFLPMHVVSALTWLVIGECRSHLEAPSW